MSAASRLVPSRRPRLIPALVAVVLLAAGVSSVERALRGSNDFEGFHRAAAAVLETGGLPDGKAIERYPPAFAVLLAPLGALPLGWAAALWFVLNAGALLRLPRLLHRLGGPPPAAQWGAWAVMSPLVVDNLVLGQSGTLLLALVLGGLVRAREGRALAGGAWLALAAVLKAMPAALLVVPLTLGRARGTLAGALATLWAVGCAIVLAVGVDEAVAGHERWLQRVSGEQTPWALVETNRSLRYNNQALGVTLARTLGDLGPRDPSGAVRVASLPLGVVWRIWAAITGACVLAGLVVLVVLRRRGGSGGDRAGGGLDDGGGPVGGPGNRPAVMLDAAPGSPSGEDRPRDPWLPLTGLAALGMLLVSPLVWTHYFVWMLPALVAVRRRSRLLWAAGAFFVLSLAVVPLRALGAHMLCVLALYAWLTAEVLAGPAPARRRPEPHAPRAATPSPR